MEELEADIDLRIIEVAAQLGEFENVSPKLFKGSSVLAYRLGEAHGMNELPTNDNLLSNHGYRKFAYRPAPTPLWLLVESPPPSDQEVADFLENDWAQAVTTKGFSWPQEPTPYVVTMAFARSAYGTAYCEIARLLSQRGWL